MNLLLNAARRAVVTSFFAVLTLVTLHAAEEPGKVQIIKATGDVSAVRLSDSSKAPVKVGDIIKEGSRVDTGKDSTAVLLFGNGSAITVNPSSSFTVNKFEQDPFDPATTNYKDLEKEPSKSTTAVTVNSGEVVGNMRKLNKGSTFEFNTPLGVAGIRGTKVYLKVSKNTDGKYTVYVAATEGTVVITTKSGETFRITKGEQITLTIPDNRPEEVRGVQDRLTPEEETRIQQEADQSVEVIPSRPFTAGADNPILDNITTSTGDQGVGTLGTQISNGSGGGGGSGSNPTPTPSPVNPAPGS